MAAGGRSAAVTVDPIARARRRAIFPTGRSLTAFHEADDFHQNYANSTERMPSRFGWIERRPAYRRYCEACGRDRRVGEIWGDAAAFAPEGASRSAAHWSGPSRERRRRCLAGP